VTRVVFVAAAVASFYWPYHARANAVATPNSRPPLIVSEYPSIVRVQNCLFVFRCGGQYVAFPLLVHAWRGRILQSIPVHTSGFGEALLIVVEDSPCPPAPEAGRSQLVLRLVTERSTRVCIFVPMSLIPEAGMTVKGDVIFSVPGFEPLATHIEVQRTPQPTRTAFLWFIGVAIPAIVAFWLNNMATKFTESRTRRRTQINAFESHKDAMNASFRTYFEDYLPGFSGKNSVEFVRAAYRELVRQGSWSQIPWKERRVLDKFLRQHQITNEEREAFKEQLCALFPEWQDDIRSL
jgi:hypothetical protein